MKEILIVTLVGLLASAGCASTPPNGTGSTQTAEASNVDLRDLAPEPTGDGDNVEAPAPGTRSSEAKLIHDISLDVSKRLSLIISEVKLIEIK